jgi:hypothetical protein
MFSIATGHRRIFGFEFMFYSDRKARMVLRITYGHEHIDTQNGSKRRDCAQMKCLEMLQPI